MIDLTYSLIIEATEDPTFFGFHSHDLEGFTGVGHPIEDCLYKAKWGMEEHITLLKEHGLPVPAPNSNPTVVIQNERNYSGIAAKRRKKHNESRQGNDSGPISPAPSGPYSIPSPVCVSCASSRLSSYK
jgi:predicted RNase H-like HicB family nuclease